jgi:hypothetical protein
MAIKHTLSHCHLFAAVVLLGTASGCITDAEPDDGTMPVGESSEASALVGRINVHRAFRPSSGEHFYTSDFNEATQAGLRLEGFNYFGLGSTQDSGSVPFYRCLLPNVRKHLYTTDINCETTILNREGQLGYIATGPESGTVPLFRLFRPSNHDHFYTISQDEVNTANQMGYVFEGISGYVLP